MATRSVEMTGVTTTRRSSVRIWRRAQEVSLGYLLLAPTLIILIVFEIFPIFYGLYISACDWRLTCVDFIGINNYLRAFDDSAVWQSLLVTATYSIIAVPVQLGLGLGLAYLLFQKVRGQQFFRVLFFTPYITSTVASAAVWSFLYNQDKGLINAILTRLGLPAFRWLGERTGVFQLLANNFNVDLPGWADGPSLAMVALVIYTTWVFVGYDIAIFLAGLGNIPTELYDAAKVDGASGWTLFRHITFPLLSPTTFFLLILTVIGTFKAFNHIWVMTQGGPVDATTTTSIYIFKQLFQFNRYGYSAALSFILFAVILALTIFQNRFAGRRVVYD
ncbi:MAG: sugar ABC transporter permease [Chloroflexi bacterium]|nr:sugar ABC transporter permease [Chloroflexota bacterium]